MKVAISAKDTALQAETDPRFGRAAYILVVDTVTREVEAVDNSENVNAFKGAGIKTATMIADRGVDVLMTGHCGPNAFKVADAAGIKVVNNISGTVEQALEKLLAGDVVYADAADVDGHW